MAMDILEQIRNPENEYRPMNYWGWLENIQPDEVRRQVREMYRAGLGGYVMHARGGLEIPYMGEEWLASVSAMIDTGKELGMLSVVDDEDGWPSGFGAGEVTAGGKDYWLKWLEFERVTVDKLKLFENTVGVYLYRDNGFHRIRDMSEVTDPSREVLHVYYRCNRYYVDNLDPRVVRKFIEASYEKYRSRFREEFGKGIWGIFSDEPQLARQYIPWSLILPSEFEKRNGYDLLDELPALFFPLENSGKLRYDFWQTVNRLFEESYSKQIGEWCGRNKMVFTGHTVYEDWLGTQLLGSAGTMTFYAHMQVPGIDWLCRTAVSNVAAKQVSSVAEQLGKKRVLSEMFGCSGWDISFEEMKWIGEKHYVLGINLMLQHLGLYSLKGARKREYPASLFYQQPWWDDFKSFNDYFGRLSKIMAESSGVVELLMLHPMKSAWIAFDGQDYEKAGWTEHWRIEGALMDGSECFKRIKQLDASFKYLTDCLLELNYDFHYGDEELLKRYGKVEHGRLKVGNCMYSVVILPPSISIDRSTLRLLTEFLDKGGKVISAGDFPGLVEGERTDEAAGLKDRVISIENKKDRLKKALSGILAPPVRVELSSGEENRDIYCCTRKKGRDLFYYIVNTSRDRAYDVNVKIREKGFLYRLDLAHCCLERLDSTDNMHLEPTESIMLLGSHEELDCGKKGIPSGRIIRSIPLRTDEDWQIEECDLNSLTLDYCRYSIDGGEWQDEIPVIKLQQEMLKLGRPADVKMAFRFYAGNLSDAPVFLVLEEPQKVQIELNGQKIECADRGWWVDRSFRKLDITGKILEGWNEIVISGHFHCSEKVYTLLKSQGVHEAELNRLKYDTELESIYLLGRFAVDFDGGLQPGERKAVFVRGPFRLSPTRPKAKLQNLVSDGFPFFAGRIALSKKVELPALKKNERLILSFERPDSIVTRVSVNGKPVKAFMWAPYRVDITDFAVCGENEFRIELVSSLRNLLGPHHNSAGELYAVSPRSFIDESSWTDRYCFVRFGIREDIVLTLVGP